MDNVILSTTRHRDRSPVGTGPSTVIEPPEPAPAAPPRLPPRAGRNHDTDARPPPIPAREPLPLTSHLHPQQQLQQQQRLWVPKQESHQHHHHHVAGPGVPPPAHVAPTAVLHPVNVDHLPPALDRIVPLSHWPFRTNNNNNSNSGSVGSSDLAIVKTLDSHHHQQQRRSPSAVVVVGGPSTSSASGTVSAGHLALPSSAVKLSAHPAGNEYVDAPTQRRNNNGVVVGALSTRSHDGGSPPSTLAPAVPADCLNLHQQQRVTLVPAVVVTQPTSPSTKFRHEDDLPVGHLSGGGLEKCVGGTRPPVEASASCRGAILCSRCGRCRCASCTAPRELPRRWIGDCECSVQRCVSVTSCVCCVQGLFYHFVDGGAAADSGCDGATDDPCACCERPRCCLRWTLMGTLAATILPCLWCYCPLQCAADGLTSCYNTCATPRGCRCRAGAAGTEASSSGASTRGLLAESESSST